MELTVKQSKGLDIAIQRYKNGAPYTVISGFAGSGKSTLVKFIVAALAECGVDPETEVGYAAFTGKAAQVLIDKGNLNAITLHKLLYKTRPTPDGKFVFIPKMKGEIEYKVLIVDECSMAPKTLVDLLLHHGVYVIFCGDNGQLPPINPDEDNHLLDNPHIFLDEVMRQAQDSGIIQLSMKIRNGESIDNFKTDDAIVLPKKELVTGMLTWGDITLCATNNTRISLNNQTRELLGKEGLIAEDEKLICLHNYWSVISENENAMTNGVIGYMKNAYEDKIITAPYLRIPGNNIPLIRGEFVSETNDNFGSIEIDKKCITTNQPFLDGKTRYKLSRTKKYQNAIPMNFTYAYAITTHKAQGSEWNKVLIIEENFPFDREEHARWLYTAVTRGSGRVVLVR